MVLQQLKIRAFMPLGTARVCSLSKIAMDYLMSDFHEEEPLYVFCMSSQSLLSRVGALYCRFGGQNVAGLSREGMHTSIDPLQDRRDCCF